MFRYIDKNSGRLFATFDLRDMLNERLSSLKNEVEQLDPNRLLNTAEPDLSNYLVEKYSLEVPRLRIDEWNVEENETRIDVSNDLNRWIVDKNKPFYIAGQQINIEIPFDGEAELFFARASTSSLTNPKAKINGQSLLLSFEITHDDQRDIRPEIDHERKEIEKNLNWVKDDVDKFNQSLVVVSKNAIDNRRDRILSNQGRVAKLGIPLKTRDVEIKTYVVPSVKRKVKPTLPPAPSTPYEPEPILDFKHYEFILNVIQNMTLVMERSPSAFRTMKEEDLRQHFLVQLNGQFEGNATGETFNLEGKTDILLRVNGRNVFIAECKFWKGSKYYNEAIDQLLGYSAWRDTKTAILVFNRDTNMTTVLDSVNKVTLNHSNYKRTLKWTHETGFRYVFHQKSDVNRELILTVLVFDVPSV